SVLALIVLLGCAGCGGEALHPLRGTVTLDDGTPVTQGVVVFERSAGGKPVTARGESRPDGSYQVGTRTPGDGVPPGKYRVLVKPLDLDDVPDEDKTLPFDLKYLKYDTSGLEYEVKAGPNEFPIQLTRPAAR